jgi:hypothetical protein
MAAGPTYEPIATANGTGSSDTITFNTIPGTYTDLILICNFITTGDQGSVAIRFNNDTATNYSNTRMVGFASPPTSGKSNNGTSIPTMFAAGGSTSNSSITTVNVFNYANTTTYKNMISRTIGTRFESGTPTFEPILMIGAWRKSPEAITRIDVINTSGNFTTNSTFTIYGIKAA